MAGLKKILDWGAPQILIEKVNKTAMTNTGVVVERVDGGNHNVIDAAILTSATDLDGGGIITGVKSIIFFIKPTTDTKLLQDNGADKIEITGGNISGTGLTENYKFVAASEENTDAVTLDKWQVIIAEFSAGISFATDWELDTTADCQIAQITMYDGLLSSQQRIEVYKKFTTLQAFTETHDWKGIERVNKRVTTNPDPDVVLDMPMLTSGGLAVDMSLSGNNGVSNGSPVPTLNGIEYNTLSDYHKHTSTVYSIHTGTYSFSFRFRFKTTNSQRGIFGSSSGTKSFIGYNSSSNVLFGETNTNSDDFAWSAAFTDTRFHTATITFNAGNYITYFDGIAGNTSVIVDALTMDRLGIGKGLLMNGVITDYKIKTRVITAQEAKDYHNSFNFPVLTDKMLYAKADGITTTPPSHIIKGTGDYVDGTINSSDAVALISAGTNYRQCTSNGTEIRQVDLDSFEDNGSISVLYYDGSWSLIEGDASTVIAAQAWLSYADKKLTITLTSGDKYSQLRLTSQVQV